MNDELGKPTRPLLRGEPAGMVGQVAGYVRVKVLDIRRNEVLLSTGGGSEVWAKVGDDVNVAFEIHVS